VSISYSKYNAARLENPLSNLSLEEAFLVHIIDVLRNKNNTLLVFNEFYPADN